MFLCDFFLNHATQNPLHNTNMRMQIKGTNSKGDFLPANAKRHRASFLFGVGFHG